jgi:hypothetical protein
VTRTLLTPACSVALVLASAGLCDQAVSWALSEDHPWSEKSLIVHASRTNEKRAGHAGPLYL